jgi:CHAT domain-containing protein
VMDARRLVLHVESERILFADDARQRQVSETLVSRLVDAEALGSALAASDQTRARSINQLLSIAEQNAAPAAMLPATWKMDVTDNVIADLSKASGAIRAIAAQALRAAGSPTILSSDEILALAADACSNALALQPVGERIHLFLVRPRGDVRLIVAESPIPTSEVAAALEQLQTELGIRAATRGLPPLVDTDDDRETLNEAIRILSDALIKPIAVGLDPESPLIVVPYRDLALIPFPLLTLPDGREIVEAHAVSVVSSFATLSLLRQPREGRGARHYFVAGDPLTDPKYRLIPLDGAASEAGDVRDSLLASGIPPENVSFHLRERATETAYRREARGARLVHLACHATVGEPASQSALFLASDNSNDGRLSPSEIAMIHLDQAFVFLSACQTGLGHPTADGVLGLSRAFLEAGARAVVMSMWKVADESTAVLAHHFYEALLAPGQQPTDAAHALQRAMIATRADLRAGQVISKRNEVVDDHPANWAPFLLLGDGGFALHG